MRRATIDGPLRVGTRRSRLALAQAAIAADALLPTVGPAQLVPIITEGDSISARRPSGGWVTGDGQFTRDLERALLDGRVDVAVHSYKDLPTAPTEGLVVGAVLERGDARDCLVTALGHGLDTVPHGGRVGTSSPRRAAQLRASRPDLVIVPVRGNVETRLARLGAGEFDALVLAAAGLDRLGIEVPVDGRLPFDVMLPAPAQGALAIQVRAGDVALRDHLSTIEHRPTRIAVEAERMLLRRIGGGCLAPLGALGQVIGSTLTLRAALELSNGSLARAEARGPVAGTPEVVDEVARQITIATVPA